MPKKRTRKQKIRATYHYAYPAGRSFTGLEATNEIPDKKAVAKSRDLLDLYQYDPIYTRRDLSKTFLVSTVMIAAELGLYFWL